MDNDDTEKKVRKFSVVKECPKCRQLSLSFKDNKLVCSSCGYNENIPSVE